MQQAPRTAIAGVSGYAGGELARLLLKHPRFQSAAPVFFGREDAAEAVPLASLHPHLKGPGTGALQVEPFCWETLAARGIEFLFLATPHEQSRAWVPQALARGMRVVDLSGAWRLREEANRAVYRFEDPDAEEAARIQSEAVYGMPELHRAQIAQARLVANPGCYATSIVLALKPLIAAGVVDLSRGIVADSKSGVSGAGKAPTANTHFMHAADNLSAYGLYGHRHFGELLEQLNVGRGEITFTPHLLPIPRGILSTVYVHFSQLETKDSIDACLREFYADSPLVRLYPSPDLPQIQYSVRTCYCDIGFHLAPDRRRCTLIACLDNLLKGAAGQAVQNMNAMCGWPETEGLL